MSPTSRNQMSYVEAHNAIHKYLHQYTAELGIKLSQVKLVMMPNENAIGGTAKFDGHVIWLPTFYFIYGDLEVKLSVISTITNYKKIIGVANEAELQANAYSVAEADHYREYFESQIEDK